MEAVTSEWLRRVDAEYHSAAAAQNFTLWLIQAGASPDLIRAGLKIVDDEIEHADLSYQTYVAAGGTQTPTIDQETLGLTRLSDDIFEDLLRVGVGFFCLGETVAVTLFQRMRKGCTEVVAKTALDRILVDEVRHRDFGWSFLHWLLEVRPALRLVLRQNLDQQFQQLRENYTADGVGAETTDQQRAWGLISRTEYAEVVARCVIRDYVPRFAECGIDFTG